MANTDSILETTKKLVGLEPDYEEFDVEILTHINSVFFTLQQLGVGPVNGFSIDDDTAVWADFIVADQIQAVKSYMGLKVRLLFDPPTTSFTLDAMKNLALEFEWRLNVQQEGVRNP